MTAKKKRSGGSNPPAASAPKKAKEKKDKAYITSPQPPPQPPAEGLGETPEPGAGTTPSYAGLIAVRRSPSFRDWKGDPLGIKKWDGVDGRPKWDEVVAVDPKNPNVQIMLRNGNLQFVADRIRGGFGDKPRIIK